MTEKELEIESLRIHTNLNGKLSIELKEDITKENLKYLYSPGVAYPCLEIQKDRVKVKEYTWVNNTVAVITNGTAVLGLGNIGSEAALPVMEGKSALLRQFGGVNSFPITIDSTDSDEIINTIANISQSFGAINLEDIKSPECVYIERELQKRVNIPVFHDDQHGTAIVVLAGLINSLKLMNKEFKDIKVTIVGTGAAGSSIIRLLHHVGVVDIYAFNKDGIVNSETADDFVLEEISKYTKGETGLSLEAAMIDSDVFIGVSSANIISSEMVKTMKKDPIIFALANPNPEIDPQIAKEAGAKIICTGRSDYPNQVNNVIAFPGIFRGLLDSGATCINTPVKIRAAHAIANLMTMEELHYENVIPDAFDPRLVPAVSNSINEYILDIGEVILDEF